ncbi:MarR family winged helix-turn-helix transcriptional regulator [Janibacter hoylei]|uniref:MarR family winged helix-turn-helix transcriptional regulator n=1 Tax=Janibacter hoylei TaxID=364298 RepID=UPI002AA2B3B9|nr:MarR family transcriptional regulator [Janibacter hoylei]
MHAHQPPHPLREHRRHRAPPVLRARPPRGRSADPRALADIEKVSAPSLTRTVACLADDGLVERHNDPQDGRRVLVELTEQGRAALTQTRRRRDKWMTERVAELTREEQETLVAASEILGRIAAR